MKRSEATYGQLDEVLRSFGLTCRLYEADPPPALVYEHKVLGTILTVPPYPKSDKVLEHHLVSARVLLDNFGIADPGAFDAAMRKAG